VEIQIQLSSEKANELNQKNGRSNSAIVSDSKQEEDFNE